VRAGQLLADAFHFLMLPLAFPAGEFLVFGCPLDGSLAGQPGFQPGEFTRPIRRACGLVPGRFGLASSALGFLDHRLVFSLQCVCLSV
jgi:hypothetical protein